MTNAERQRAIRDRANAIVAEMLAKLERGEDLDAIEILMLTIRGIGIRATQHSGERVTLHPTDVAALANGAAALLTEWTAVDVDEAARREAELERALASKPPAILH